MLEKRKQPEVG